VVINGDSRKAEFRDFGTIGNLKRKRTIPAQRPDSLAAKGSGRARWVCQAMVPLHDSCFWNGGNCDAAILPH